MLPTGDGTRCAYTADKYMPCTYLLGACAIQKIITPSPSIIMMWSGWDRGKNYTFINTTILSGKPLKIPLSTNIMYWDLVDTCTVTTWITYVTLFMTYAHPLKVKGYGYITLRRYLTLKIPFYVSNLRNTVAQPSIFRWMSASVTNTSRRYHTMILYTQLLKSWWSHYKVIHLVADWIHKRSFWTLSRTIEV